MVPGLGGVTAATRRTNTWAGNIALWHEHDGLCLVGTSSASEGETPASCKAKGGAYTAALKWMMHVWVVPGHENADGVFAYLNNGLYTEQQAAGNTAAPCSRTARSRSNQHAKASERERPPNRRGASTSGSRRHRYNAGVARFPHRPRDPDPRHEI